MWEYKVFLLWRHARTHIFMFRKCFSISVKALLDYMTCFSRKSSHLTKYLKFLLRKFYMQIFTKLSNRFKYSKSRKLQASAQTRLTAKTIYAVPGNSVIIDASLADKLTLYWGELSHCATPGSATSTAAHSHKTHGRWTPSDSAIMKDLRANRRSFLFSTLSFVKRPSSANRQRANRSAAEAIAASLAVAENRKYSGAP